jgi:hypothetical protein
MFLMFEVNFSAGSEVEEAQQRTRGAMLRNARAGHLCAKQVSLLVNTLPCTSLALDSDTGSGRLPDSRHAERSANAAL